MPSMGVPYFRGENPAEFCVWGAMAHRQGFMLVYVTRANMLLLGRARPLKALIILMCVAYTGKPMSLR